MKRFSPLLLELISMVVIFSLCATVCMRLLVGAWDLSRSSERLTRAVHLAESAAARLQAGLPYEGGAEGAYVVRLGENGAGPGLREMLIAVDYEEELLYTLTVTVEELP